MQHNESHRREIPAFYLEYKKSKGKDMHVLLPTPSPSSFDKLRAEYLVEKCSFFQDNYKIFKVI